MGQIGANGEEVEWSDIEISDIGGRDIGCDGELGNEEVVDGIDEWVRINGIRSKTRLMV